MVLPPTGAISFQDVNTEIRRTPTNSLNLNDATVRKLADVPSGTIGMSNLQGKSVVRINTDGFGGTGRGTAFASMVFERNGVLMIVLSSSNIPENDQINLEIEDSWSFIRLANIANDYEIKADITDVFETGDGEAFLFGPFFGTFANMGDRVFLEIAVTAPAFEEGVEEPTSHFLSIAFTITIRHKASQRIAIVKPVSLSASATGIGFVPGPTPPGEPQF